MYAYFKIFDYVIKFASDLLQVRLGMAFVLVLQFPQEANHHATTKLLLKQP